MFSSNNTPSETSSNTTPISTMYQSWTAPMTLTSTDSNDNNNSVASISTATTMTTNASSVAILDNLSTTSISNIYETPIANNTTKSVLANDEDPPIIIEETNSMSSPTLSTKSVESPTSLNSCTIPTASSSSNTSNASSTSSSIMNNKPTLIINNRAKDTVTSYRFIVEIKDGRTAKIQFNNLLQLMQQNAAIRNRQMKSNLTESNKLKKEKKKKRPLPTNEDEEKEEEEDTNKEIELTSSEEEEGEGESSSNNEEEDEGEIKFGEEGKQAEAEKPKKRLKKSNDIPLFEKDNRQVSHLERVMTNILTREHSLKNTLIKKNLHKKGNSYVEKNPVDEKSGSSRKGDWYVYSSDDSFLDDTEYDDYIIAEEMNVPQSAARKSSDFYIFSKDAVAVTSETEESELDEEEEDNHGLVITEPPKETKPVDEDDDDADDTLEPELEAAIEELKKKAATLEKDTYQSIPHDLDQSLLNVAILREKYYKRGVPRKLLKRLRTINGLKFTDKTIKDRLKFVLKKFNTDSITAEINNLKKQFKESVILDMRRALQHKTKKDTKSKKNTLTEPNNEDYNTMSHEELKKRLKDTEGIRVIWSNATTELFLKLCQIKEESIAKENEIRKTSKKLELLDPNEELSKLFSELKSYLYKNQNLMKKYKSFKEKNVKKEEVKDEKASEATPKKDDKKKDAGKKDETKKDDKKNDDKKKDEKKKNEKKIIMSKESSVKKENKT